MKQEKKRHPVEIPGTSGTEDAGLEKGDERPTMEPAGGAGSPLRVVVLVLLLVAAAAAGLLTYLGQIQPLGAPPAEAEKHRIAMPRPGSPAAAPSEEKVETVRVESRPIAIAVPPQPGSPAVPAAQVEIHPPAPTPPPVSPAPSEKAPVGGGVFSLETGPLVLPRELASAEKALRRLGFEPRRMSARQEVTLIRLRAGEYPPAEAKTRLAELLASVPSAFSLPRGDQVAVYAATYYDIDKARTFADQLYGKGIRLEEEQAQVAITVQRLRFGSFPDRAAAARAADRTAAAGLETSIVRQR